MPIALLYGDVHVCGSAGIGTRLGPFAVTGTIHLSATNATAGQGKRVDTRMMVSTAIVVDLGRAPKVGERWTNLEFFKVVTRIRDDSSSP
jgi:hypothetical protein